MYAGERISQKKNCISSREGQLVRRFFERDDVSRITSGKKCTVTRRKDKRQNRLLTDSLKNLHNKYKAENNRVISFTTFYRLKPFWVVAPCENDRDTCLCKLCENMRYTSESLQNLGLIPLCHIDSLVQQVVCDTNNKACMYAQCYNCKGKEFSVSNEKINDSINWKYWITAEKHIVQNGQKRKITTVVKENRTIIDIFHQYLSRYRTFI